MSEVLQACTYGPVSGKEPKQLVIFLHGLGANGRDLIDLGQHFGAALPDAVFVSPDAPFPCDMAPVGYQWFSLQEWTPESILSGVQQATPILQNFIDGQLEKYGLTDDRLALVGFSQGTMMGLYAGLRREKPVAGILGYSGALVWEDDVDTDALQKTPICLIHGEADPVVPLKAYHHARENLEKAGFDVSGHTTAGLMHGIDPAGIEEGQKFLKTIFS